jgi:hypothetical protein
MTTRALLKSWVMLLIIVPMMVLVVATASAADADGPRFPLSVAVGGRYLEDATGRPFLMHGDTAWSLIADLTREDAELYLTDRAARGFNTILVELIESKFATNAPANAYREPPFLVAGDYSTPNEKYFAHADWILSRARELGIAVLLTPSYIGGGGGEEGWYRVMGANGPDKLRDYGRYLGRRYKGYDNIIWVHGGDYDPPNRSLVTAIADGIVEIDRRVLHTAHGSPETPVSEFWRDQAWLKIDNVYTYHSVHKAALEQYARGTGRPFFLIETKYENEREATGRDLRTQAYHALLGGASGQIFGNNPIWHFNGPSLYQAPTGWKGALDSPGSRDMTHLHALFNSLPWWRLVPDVDNLVLVRGHETGRQGVASAITGLLVAWRNGTDLQRAAAAITSDRALALVYIPSARTVSIDLDRLRGPRMSARWFDPTSGRFMAEDPPQRNTGRVDFTTPGLNDRGQDDWVLVLEAKPNS